MLFTQKNPTPRQLAIITALNISMFLLVSLVVFKLLIPTSVEWWGVLLFPILVFTAAYFSVAEALTRFIYRKIKLIYKTIHTVKTGRKDPGGAIDLSHHIIDEVEAEVRQWAVERSKEIEDLKMMEDYRRDFFGNVSHELKTPIFNIQGYLYTLLDGGMDDRNILEPYLKKAADNVDRLENIVQDLTTISQLESGAMQLEMSRFNAVDLVKEVFDDFALQAAEKNVKLAFKEGSAKRAFWVRADYESMRTVFSNLIGNSIKYGKQNGKTLVGFYDLENNILAEISDDGIGIGREHLGRLFERFYRVDKGRARDQGGTGLGLAIVKHIMEAHQQSVHVRSSVGVGSTFGLTMEKSEEV